MVSWLLVLRYRIFVFWTEKLFGWPTYGATITNTLFYIRKRSCRIQQFSSNLPVCRLNQCASYIAFFCGNFYSALLALTNRQ